MKKTLAKIVSLLLFLSMIGIAQGQVKVDVNFDINHTIGGKTTFDREKYITIHADFTDGGYNGQLDMLDYLVNDLDVYFGRGTGSMRFEVNQLREDPARPGFADPADMVTKARISKNNYANNTSRHPFEKGDWITAAQDVPFYANGANATNQGWFFSTADTASEPFGTALGEYMGRFITQYHGTGGATGKPIPKWVEVMNEPVWPLVDVDRHGGGTIDNIFKMHSSVADQIKIYAPNTKVGGFCTAFPDLEKNNFNQWEERWKRFIDEVGPKMDFYSIHLYDFPGIFGGKEQYRKGGHMEATMDMIEQYNTIRYGNVKPWVISEYGSQLNDWFNEPWSPYRDWLILKAFSSMTLQFMERPDVIAKVIPFAIAQAEWGRQGPNIPYYWRLMRREDEPILDPTVTASGDWIWTEVIKYYELWSDVKGTRVDTFSTDLDLMVDAYVDNNKAYLILNNIDESDLTININELGLDSNTVTSAKIKHLYRDTKGTATTTDDIPVLDIQTFSNIPNTVTVGEEGCMIIEYTFDNKVDISGSSTEKKTYASTYKQEIVKDQEIEFTIPNITKGAFGEGILRLGVGRSLTANRVPQVTINNIPLQVPTDYRGDNQEDKNSFFAVIEIPVPYSAIKTGDNKVKVTFDDNGGFVSTCALQNFEFTRAIDRSDSSRDRAISFDNKSAYIPASATELVFDYGQIVPIKITYATGSTGPGAEEDLSYVAVRIREKNSMGDVIKRSEFTTMHNGTNPNVGTFTYDYTIPSVFEDGSNIPDETTLTPGHSLDLNIFMAVDGVSGFLSIPESKLMISRANLSLAPIIQNNKKNIVMYPNPTDQKLYFSEKINNWMLYDLRGIKIQEGTQTPIDVENLPVGMYYIAINGQIGNAIRFIKK